MPPRFPLRKRTTPPSVPQFHLHRILPKQTQPRGAGVCGNDISSIYSLQKFSHWPLMIETTKESSINSLIGNVPRKWWLHMLEGCSKRYRMQRSRKLSIVYRVLCDHIAGGEIELDRKCSSTGSAAAGFKHTLLRCLDVTSNLLTA